MALSVMQSASCRFGWFLKEGQVNTLMAGIRSARGRYSAAGYMQGERRQEREQMQEKPLYISSVPAGSAQDALRDFNRTGYQAERPWRETPEPLFEQAAGSAAEQPITGVAVPGRSAQKRRAAESARTRRDIAACVVLGCAVLMILALWGQKMVQGVRIQNDIKAYEDGTKVLQAEIADLRQQLEIAKDGTRIRNLAQNRLGMLRPERAQTQTIYIQNAGEGQKKQVQEQEKPELGILDLLLGLLDMLNIGE